MKPAIKSALLGACIFSALTASSYAENSGQVTFVKGNAHITHNELKPVVQNLKLKVGDQIGTGEGSTVRVKFAACELEIPPLHYVRIKDLNECPTLVALNNGAAATAKAGTTGAAQAGASKAATTGAIATGGTTAGVWAFGIGAAALAAAIHNDNKDSSPD